MTSASISPHAKIGKNVSIGAHTIIHDHVEIGDDSIIDSFCEIGYPSKLAAGKPLVIGANALIRSHSVFYQGSTFGPGLSTGHRVTIREGVTAGPGLQIGTLSDFQGDCVIGDYVRTHSNVHIGKHSRVGNYVWIFPYVVLTNDPHPPSEVMQGVTLEDYSVVATMSVLLPGITVGKGALVAAHSMVNRDVMPEMVVGGNPAKVLAATKDIKRKDTGEPAYPWPRHFHRGYPQELVDAWQARFAASD